MAISAALSLGSEQRSRYLPSKLASALTLVTSRQSLPAQVATPNSQRWPTRPAWRSRPATLRAQARHIEIESHRAPVVLSHHDERGLESGDSGQVGESDPNTGSR